MVYFYVLWEFVPNRTILKYSVFYQCVALSTCRRLSEFPLPAFSSTVERAAVMHIKHKGP